MKDKRPEYQKVVIDGDTLKKRREQRAEQMEKFIWQVTPEQRKGISGVVNQWTKEEGTRVVPSSQSVYNLDAGPNKELRDLAVQHEFDVPPIIKRTPQQRIEAFAARLKTAPAWQVEPILKEVASEYWKAGMPVSAEDLRAVAAHYLNRTERKKA